MYTAQNNGSRTPSVSITVGPGNCFSPFSACITEYHSWGQTINNRSFLGSCFWQLDSPRLRTTSAKDLHAWLCMPREGRTSMVAHSKKAGIHPLKGIRILMIYSSFQDITSSLNVTVAIIFQHEFWMSHLNHSRKLSSPPILIYMNRADQQWLWSPLGITIPPTGQSQWYK